MKQITGTMSVPLTNEEVNEINALIARDEAKPIVVEHQSEEYTLYKCPACGGSLIGMTKRTHFCEKCGQRIDRENIAL